MEDATIKFCRKSNVGAGIYEHVLSILCLFMNSLDFYLFMYCISSFYSCSTLIFNLEKNSSAFANALSHVSPGYATSSSPSVFIACENEEDEKSFGPCDVLVGFPKFDRWPTLTLLATVASSVITGCVMHGTT
jgi:hypothetical protein